LDRGTLQEVYYIEHNNIDFLNLMNKITGKSERK